MVLATFFLVEKKGPQKEERKRNNAKYYGHYVCASSHGQRTHSARTNSTRYGEEESQAQYIQGARTSIGICISFLLRVNITAGVMG